MNVLLNCLDHRSVMIFGSKKHYKLVYTLKLTAVHKSSDFSSFVGFPYICFSLRLPASYSILGPILGICHFGHSKTLVGRDHARYGSMFYKNPKLHKNSGTAH